MNPKTQALIDAANELLKEINSQGNDYWEARIKLRNAIIQMEEGSSREGLRAYLEYLNGIHDEYISTHARDFLPILTKVIDSWGPK